MLQAYIDKLTSTVNVINEYLADIDRRHRISIPYLSDGVTEITNKIDIWKLQSENAGLQHDQREQLLKDVQSELSKQEETLNQLEILQNRLEGQSPSHKGTGIYQFTRLRQRRPVSGVLGEKARRVDRRFSRT